MPLHAKVRKAIELYNEGVSKANICKIIEIKHKTLNNVLEQFQQGKLQSHQLTKSEIKHRQKLKEKQELIKEVKAMYKKCNNISKIAKHFNLDRRTIT